MDSYCVGKGMYWANVNYYMAFMFANPFVLKPAFKQEQKPIVFVFVFPLCLRILMRFVNSKME